MHVAPGPIVVCSPGVLAPDYLVIFGGDDELMDFLHLTPDQFHELLHAVNSLHWNPRAK